MNESLRQILGDAFPALVDNNRLQSDEAMLTQLTVGLPPLKCRGYDMAKDAERYQRGLALYRLWRDRYRADVAAQVLPYLQDDDWGLRWSALRLLGRLESPLGEVALRNALALITSPNGGVRRNNGLVQIGLARLSARGLRGEEKLSRFAEGVGLSWPQIGRLSEIVQVKWSRTNNSAGQNIVWETVDILYAMAKKGEDIAPFVKVLTLHTSHQVLLQNTHLPPAQEAAALVDYLAQLDVYSLYDMNVSDFYLGTMEPFGTEAVMARLAAAHDQNLMWGALGYAPLLRHIGFGSTAKADLTRINNYENSSDPILREYAQQAGAELRKLNKHTPFPRQMIPMI